MPSRGGVIFFSYKACFIYSWKALEKCNPMVLFALSYFDTGCLKKSENRRKNRFLVCTIFAHFFEKKLSFLLTFSIFLCLKSLKKLKKAVIFCNIGLG